MLCILAMKYSSRSGSRQFIMKSTDVLYNWGTLKRTLSHYSYITPIAALHSDYDAKYSYWTSMSALITCYEIGLLHEASSHRLHSSSTIAPWGPLGSEETFQLLHTEPSVNLCLCDRDSAPTGLSWALRIVLPLSRHQLRIRSGSPCGEEGGCWGDWSTWSPPCWLDEHSGECRQERWEGSNVLLLPANICPHHRTPNISGNYVQCP